MLKDTDLWRITGTSTGRGSGSGIVIPVRSQTAGPSLYQNHPNPFRNGTLIRYELASTCFVKILVYDLAGVQRASLVNAIMPAGEHFLGFDRDCLPAGFYYYALVSGGRRLCRKMIIID